MMKNCFGAEVKFGGGLRADFILKNRQKEGTLEAKK